MANGADFLILTLYHRGTSKEDPIFDCIANNFDKFAEGVQKDAPGDGKEIPTGRDGWLTT